MYLGKLRKESVSAVDGAGIFHLPKYIFFLVLFSSLRGIGVDVEVFV